jgi:hypothetical protein
MSNEHIIKENPFGPEKKDNGGSGDSNPSLAVRIGYGSPEKPAETTNKPAETTAKPAETTAKPAEPTAKPAETTAKPVDRVSAAGDKPANAPESPRAKADTQAIYDIQKTYAQVQEIQRTLVNTCFDKQPDGSFKPKDDKAKIQDGSKDGTTVEAVRAMLIGQMSEKYEQAVNRADESMKNPDLVQGITLAARNKLENAQQNTKTLQEDLKRNGIDPSVGGYLDATLVNRYLDEHKDLGGAQRQQVIKLSQSLQQQAQAETQYRDLRILQETPVVARQAYADFLRTINLPNAADKWMNDAKKVAEELNSPAGRSEFMKRMSDQTTQDKNDSLDKNLQDKYLKPVQDLETLVAGAAEKAKAGDLAGARAAMDQARVLAGKMPAVDKVDEDQVKVRSDALLKDRDSLNQKLKDGTATPHDVALQQEREYKLINEARLIDAVKLAKPNVDIAYAEFLLTADKDKNSEANRTAARDILMGVKYDATGKLAAAQNGERFDKLLEQSLNGNVDNQAAMKAFNTAMQQYDALKQQAAGEKKDENIAKDFQAARAKASEAVDIASHINRDAADANQKAIMQQLQKQIDAEKAKPAAEQDKGKIELMQVAMKPTYQLNAHEKQLVAGLTECMKPEGQANKQAIDGIAGMLKDKSALFDIVSSYSMIQQMEFQKQAVNQARIAMLDIDVAFGKGEKSPLVRDIENDKYGADMINALNSIPGHDGRTQWGDIKEATRDLAWYEKAWKWTKGALKEVAISLASWGVGALAGIGAAALFSWSGPGAVVGGAAVGFAAGAATGSAIRYAIGDKVTLMGAALDGVSGMTGGIAGTSYAVARAAGTAAVANVVEQQAARGVTIGANQTWQAFKYAGMADKFRIAAGGSRFLASFTAATTSSVAYRIPTEAMTGNYEDFGDYAKGTGIKIATDVPTNLLTAWIGGRGPGSTGVQAAELSKNFYNSASKQLASNFLWSSPGGKNMFGGMPQIRRSEFNAPVYDAVQPKPEDQEKK